MSGLEFGPVVYPSGFLLMQGRSVPSVSETKCATGIGPAIRGVGATYALHKSNSDDWDFDLFKPGCFTNWIASGKKTDFHRWHDHRHSFGSTDWGNLFLCDTPTVLVYEIRLGDDELSCKLFDEVASGAAPEASVGFCPVDFKFVDLGSWRVRVVDEAWLGEISVCRGAAIPGTTAWACDQKYLTPLAEAATRGIVDSDAAAAAVLTRIDALRLRLAA